MTNHKTPSILAELTVRCDSCRLCWLRQLLRDYIKDRDIDKLNAKRTDGLVHYGSKYIRNGKRFRVIDYSNSPYRDYNLQRVFDVLDAIHRDPETRHTGGTTIGSGTVCGTLNHYRQKNRKYKDGVRGTDTDSRRIKFLPFTWWCVKLGNFLTRCRQKQYETGKNGVAKTYSVKF